MRVYDLEFEFDGKPWFHSREIGLGIGKPRDLIVYERGRGLPPVRRGFKLLRVRAADLRQLDGTWMMDLILVMGRPKLEESRLKFRMGATQAQNLYGTLRAWEGEKVNLHLPIDLEDEDCDITVKEDVPLEHQLKLFG